MCLSLKPSIPARDQPGHPSMSEHHRASDAPNPRPAYAEEAEKA
jgi:hypothetical protein